MLVHEACVITDSEVEVTKDTGLQKRDSPAADETAGHACGQGAGLVSTNSVEAGHGGALGNGGAGELAHLAVGGQEGRAEEAVGAAHDGHGHAPLGGVHVLGLVRLPQHAVHGRRQVVEAELHVEVGEAVVVPDVVAVHLALLLADGDDGERHSHLLLDGEVHGIGCADAVEGQDAIGGRPRRSLEVEELAVVGELELINGTVPLGDAFGGDGEGVGTEDEAQRLHPGEVAEATLGALADEVGVDVEVGVGDEAEVLVHASVEVEGDAVAADDLGVSAHATFLIAPLCELWQSRVISCIQWVPNKAWALCKRT